MSTGPGNGADSVALPGRSESPAGSPRSASISLQAAATMNAGLQHEPGRRLSNSSAVRHRQSASNGRRRSAVLMNLHINDPSIPGPGEMVADSGNRTSSPHSMTGSPLLLARDHHHLHHQRAPSLGELHQELEEEQEAHVNRLLHMIRQEQAQINHLQASASAGPGPAAASASAVAGDDPADPSERSGGHHGTSGPGPAHTTSNDSLPRSPNPPYHPRGSFEQRRSRTPSQAASPRLRATSISAESGDWPLGGRDESAFYQAETQMLTRENQMLKLRVRELERIISELVSPTSPVTHEPAHHSHLAQSQSAAPDDQDSSVGAPKKPTAEGEGAATEAAKSG